jgi:hypothetical protein
MDQIRSPLLIGQLSGVVPNPIPLSPSAHTRRLERQFGAPVIQSSELFDRLWAIDPLQVIL